jgi:hypothetical protein
MLRPKPSGHHQGPFLIQNIMLELSVVTHSYLQGMIPFTNFAFTGLFLKTFSHAE